MPRETLPQNYIIDPGTAWCDFSDDHSGWDGTHTIDTTVFKASTQSLKMSVIASSFISWTINENLSNVKDFGLWVYCHDASPIATIGILSVNIRSVTNYAKYFMFEYGGYMLCHGWNYLSINRNEFSNVGSESWDNTMLRFGLRVAPVTSQTANVSFGGIYKNFAGNPKALISLDDGAGTVISQAYPYMADRGLRGTCYINSSTISASGQMTPANLDTLYAAGWAIANHGSVHTSFSTISASAASSLITTCRDWLLARGYTRSANHLAYPYGGYNADTLTVAADAGCLTGRLGSGFKFTPSAGRNNLVLPAQYVNRTDTLAVAKAYIDLAILAGKTIFLIFHKIVESPAATDEWSIADFQALMSYLVARKISCVTIDEWWKGLTNPRYLSVPLGRTSV